MTSPVSMFRAPAATDLAFRAQALQEAADRQRLIAMEWDERGDPTMGAVMHKVADRTLMDAARYAARAGLALFLAAAFAACAQIDDAVGYDRDRDEAAPSREAGAEVVAVWDPEARSAFAPELNAALCLVQHTLSAQSWSCLDHAYAPGVLADGWVQQFECVSDEGGSVMLADCDAVRVDGLTVTQCEILGDVEGYVHVGEGAAYHSTFGPALCDLATGVYGPL